MTGVQTCALPISRGVDGGGRRRIDPRQQERIDCSPFRACEQQGCEIGRANLGLGESGKALRLWLIPQAKADAGLSTASAAPPLIGGGTRHAHSLEPRHADVRLETWNSRKTAVDDDMHALDGDRRFGDRGREHYLAQVLGRWLERKVLRLHVHRAVKGGKRDRRIADALLQPLLDPPDLALTRQERQD